MHSAYTSRELEKLDEKLSAEENEVNVTSASSSTTAGTAAAAATTTTGATTGAIVLMMIDASITWVDELRIVDGSEQIDSKSERPAERKRNSTSHAVMMSAMAVVVAVMTIAVEVVDVDVDVDVQVATDDGMGARGSAVTLQSSSSATAVEMDSESQAHSSLLTRHPRSVRVRASMLEATCVQAASHFFSLLTFSWTLSAAAAHSTAR